MCCAVHHCDIFQEVHEPGQRCGQAPDQACMRAANLSKINAMLHSPVQGVSEPLHTFRPCA